MAIISDSQIIQVLFITHNYVRHKGDFAGVFLHLLAKKLKEYNIDVIVLAPHDAGLKEYEVIEGIRIYRFRYGSDAQETFAYRGDMHRQLFKNPFKIFRLISFIRSARKLAQTIVEKEKLNVISVHWVVPNGLIGYSLKKKYGDKMKLFLSSHGTDIRLLGNIPFTYTFFKRAVKLADKWTVVSNYLKKIILEKDKGIADKIEVIALPNDESLFFPDQSIHKEPNYIVAVSRLTVQKRISILIMAMNKVIQEIPETKLEIYGAGPEKEALQKLISSLDLNEYIKICNPIPQNELRKVYCRAGMVVLNSINEGFGLALTEAMLCRTAVIGTDSGGIPDIIDHEKTGLLVSPDDSNKLADAIIRMIKDHRLRTQLAMKGYNKALENFSANSSAKRYAAIFRGK
jgi:glycosyltransferase involved in cell wall biosynthesis